MDFENKHPDDELLNRLLKEYLLEEGEERAVRQSLEILSEGAMRQETVLEPGTQREKTLEKIRPGKSGFNLGFNGATVLGILLLLFLTTALFIFLSSDKHASSDITFSPPLHTKEQTITPASNTHQEEIPAEPNQLTTHQNTVPKHSSTHPEKSKPRIPLSVSAPDNKPTDFKWLNEKLGRVNDNLPKDRLYLRTDKSLYKTGERVWLVVYVRDAATLQKSEMSDIVYVHLINPKNQVEKSIRLIAHDGIASGDFLLETQYPGGIYKLKTYTNWQKNEPGIKFYEKEIQVQQLIDSDIALKLDFEKEQFSKDEKIKATVKFQNSKGEPVRDFSFQCVVTLSDEKKLEFEKTTNAYGSAYLEFKLPEKADAGKGFLNFYFEYKGNKEFLSQQIPVHSSGLLFELFPEGGQLVEGITSKVAFQALDNNGMSLDVEGEVMDNSGNKIVAFSSVHEGRGFFEFTPEAGKTYKASVKNGSIRKVIPVPAAITKGFVLQVDSVTAEYVYLSVKSSTASEVYMAGILRGKLCYNDKYDMVSGENKIKMPVAKLPMGVLQITLFDKRGIPQAERLVFVNPQKKLNIELTANQNSFALHQKVTLNLTTKNEQGTKQPAQLSLSVMNEQLLADNNNASKGIFSGLFLTPELKTENINTECYFLAQQDCGAAELDLLMLTKGWRKFSWENFSEPKRTGAYTNELAKIAGRILDPVNSQPMQGVEITLPGNEKTTTDLKGHFSFENLNLEERLEMTLAYGKEKMSYYISEYDDNMEIIFYGDGKKIYQPEEKGVRHPLVKALRKSSAENAIVLGKIVNRNYEPLPGASVQLLRNGETVASTSSDINGYYQLEINESGVFDLVIAHPDFREHSYTGSKIEKGKALLLDVLLSDEKLPVDSMKKTTAMASLSSDYPVRVPALKTTELNLASGVDFSKVLGGFSNTYDVDDLGNLHMKEFKDKNNIYLDGLSLEYNKPVSISKSNIEQVSIYNSSEAPTGQDGKTDYIIEIKTTADEEETSSNAKELFISRYYRAREFPRIYYNPDKKEPVGNDFRTTLYWNPTLKADANGNATVEFYNSDVPGKYKVIVEGISEDGKAGYAELVFEVKE